MKTFPEHTPISQAGQTRMTINRARLGLQAKAARDRGAGFDLFLAIFTGAMLGWLVVGAGLV